jgi:hypothetical protein
MRLLSTAKTRMKINPYRIEIPKLFDSILTLPLHLPSGWQLFDTFCTARPIDTSFFLVQAYSGKVESRIKILCFFLKMNRILVFYSANVFHYKANNTVEG